MGNHRGPLILTIQFFMVVEYLVVSFVGKDMKIVHKKIASKSGKR